MIASRPTGVIPFVRLRPDGPPSTLSIASGRLVGIEPAEEASASEPVLVDGRGLIASPGLVDIHCHLVGGGGSHGPATRPLPVCADDLLGAGITTVAGCLGRDILPSAMWHALRTARGLRQEGIDASLFTGGLGPKPRYLLSHPGHDVALLDGVVGMKIGLDRDSPRRSGAELANQVLEVVAFAREMGRRARFQVHVGADPSFIEQCHDLFSGLGVGEEFDLAVTHMNWTPDHVKQAAILAELGSWIDLTATLDPAQFPGAVSVVEALGTLLETGIAPSGISVSSDSNGAHVEGQSPPRVIRHLPTVLWDTYRAVVGGHGREVAEEVFSAAPSAFLGLATKGRVEVGYDADVLLTGPDGRLRAVVTAGGAVRQWAI